jgi:hypothetical protein
MESEGKGLLGKVIIAAILLIFGAVMVGVVADASYPKTIGTAVNSEAHNVLPTYATGFNGTNINPTIVYTLTNSNTYGGDCPVTNLVLTNSSGTAFTETTDYVFTATTAKYTLVDSATALANLGANSTAKPVYATYKYCGEGYVSGWGGVILNLIGGFLALLLFGAAVGVMYSIYKDVTD